MNLVQLKADAVYVDSDNIAVIIQRPDVNGKKPENIDAADRSMYEKANNIIKKADAAGKYFDVSGRDDVVRGLIILKDGTVIGTNNNPETIVRRIKSEMKASQGGRKTARRENT